MSATTSEVLQLKALLMQVVRSFTHNHQHLTCELFTPTSDLVILSLQVERTDHRKVVGKGGNTIDALTRIFRDIGSKMGLKVVVKLSDAKELSVEPAKRPFDQSADYDAERITHLLEALIGLLTGDLLPINVSSIPGITVFKVLGQLKPQHETDLRTITELMGNHERRQFFLEVEGA